MADDAPVLTELATGLRFPEGPIVMPDGSVILVEIARGTLSRVLPDGHVEVIAAPGGGPNGAAVGPDGAIYVCNNGGFIWHERGDLLFPGNQPADYSGGRIERIDPETGAVDVLYTHCENRPLRGPNDIVFDGTGGFWFTDHGKTRERDRDRTGVFYARADGSGIEEVIFPLEGPNGIGLSPGDDALYVAETPTGRLWRFELDGPGKLRSTRADGRTLMPGAADFHMYDSLAVDAGGRVCVATLINGGITVVEEDGYRHVPMPDPLTTNICFGGDDLKTAYVTLSSTGRLVSLPWDDAGLALHFLNR